MCTEKGRNMLRTMEENNKSSRSISLHVNSSNVNKSKKIAIQVGREMLTSIVQLFPHSPTGPQWKCFHFLVPSACMYSNVFAPIFYLYTYVCILLNFTK